MPLARRENQELTMQIKQVVSDANGETHFEDYSMQMRYPDHGMEGFPLRSPLFRCSHFGIVELPAGYEGPQELSSRRQIALCLAGKLRLTTSDGETQEFGPGDIVMMDDRDGKGHILTVIGGEKARIGVAHLED